MLRIAMWSGPRNISTAMLRSWENRTDTFVCDEPLYAHYLVETGLPHPGRDEIIQHHEPDWRKVVAELTGPIPNNQPIYYQKHMAHHLLPNIERDWLAHLTHCFLIREPGEMLTSLLNKYEQVGLADTGMPQQRELFERVRNETGTVPPILDARDVLTDPRGMLKTLCRKLDIEFQEQMLSWPAGRRSTDGIWARHWYDSVERSTGFQAYKPKNQSVPDDHQGLLQECQEIYDQLYPERLTTD